MRKVFWWWNVEIYDVTILLDIVKLSRHEILQMVFKPKKTSLAWQLSHTGPTSNKHTNNKNCCLPARTKFSRGYLLQYYSKCLRSYMCYETKRISTSLIFCIYQWTSMTLSVVAVAVDQTYVIYFASSDRCFVWVFKLMVRALKHRAMAVGTPALGPAQTKRRLECVAPGDTVLSVRRTRF